MTTTLKNNYTEPTLNITPLFGKTPPVDTLLTRPNPPPDAPLLDKGCAVTVGREMVRGELMWRVRYPEHGKPKRKYFTGQDAADAFAAECRGETLTNRKRLALLPGPEADLLWLIYTTAQSRQVPLSNVYASLLGGTLDKKDVPSYKAVVQAIVAEMNDTHKDEDYIKNFQQTADKFGAGMEEMPINQFHVEHLKPFLKGKSRGYVKSLRSRLSTIFMFAMREGWRTDNPCVRLGKLSKKGDNRQIVTIEVNESDAALRWLAQNPKGLAWFILSSKAGLRPEDEACFTEWADIDLAKKCIVVNADRCKTGDRRVVYPPDMVFDWLQWAKDHGAQLPLTLNEKTTIQRKLRAVLGWKEWKQDCTRHSAASYLMAMTNDVKKVSRSLGHSVATLEGHYDARKHEHEGQEFYAQTVDQYVKVEPQ